MDNAFLADLPRLGTLVGHRYGKAGVRLLRLDRSVEPHQLFDATIEIVLEGSFEEAYAEGDNRRVLPTDSMKNTVYALARERSFETPEGLARLLARHFISTQGQVTRATVHVVEKPWDQHGEHVAAFVRGPERRSATAVAAAGAEAVVSSGLEGLGLLKSSDSGFSNFPRDRYTLLEDNDDRLIATQIAARWDYTPVEGVDFTDARKRVRAALLEAFATHESRSLQHTLYWMAEAALEAVPEVERISLRLPNQHCLLASLEDVGLDNPNYIFVPTDEPYGVIEGTVERSGAEAEKTAEAAGLIASSVDQAVRC